MVLKICYRSSQKWFRKGNYSKFVHNKHGFRIQVRKFCFNKHSINIYIYFFCFVLGAVRSCKFYVMSRKHFTMYNIKFNAVYFHRRAVWNCLWTQKEVINAVRNLLFYCFTFFVIFVSFNFYNIALTFN